MSDMPRDGVEPIRSDFSGDPEMAELIQEFVTGLGDRSGKLREALQSGSLDYIQSEAHRLRGAAAGYGFAAIGDAAGQLEDLLRADQQRVQSQAEAIRDGVHQLVELCGRAIA
ncbi:MAG: Hpt domain-containing protein [Planctomycetota bacterium]